MYLRENLVTCIGIRKETHFFTVIVDDTAKNWVILIPYQKGAIECKYSIRPENTFTTGAHLAKVGRICVNRIPRRSNTIALVIYKKRTYRSHPEGL